MTDELETAPLPDPVPQPAPVVAPDPVPAAVPSPGSVPPPGSTARRNRVLGTVAQVVGVIGIVLCLVLAGGVLVVRGSVTDTVNEVSAGIDAKVARAVPLLDTASQKVSEVSGRVGAVADAASALAARPNPPAEMLQGLIGAVTNVSAGYQNLRSTYVDFREAAVTSLDRLTTLDRLIPGIAIPQGPVDAISSLDEALTSLDTKIMGLASAIPESGPVDVAATAIATSAGDVEAVLQSLVGAIDNAQVRLEELRAQLASTTDTITTTISIGTIGMILVLLYFALLHWVLFRTGAALRRTTGGG